MKTIVLNLIAFAVATSALAQTDKTPYMTKSLKGVTIRSVNMQTSVGALSVTGSGEPRVEVYITNGGNHRELSKEQIDEKLKNDYTLSVEAKNGELTAVAKPKRQLNNENLSISFRAYVPAKVKTELNTSVGAISLEGLQGEQHVKTSVGAISVSNCDGDLELRSSTGALSLANTKGKAEAITSTGAISANNFNGELQAKTSTGSLQLSKISGSVEASSSTGSAKVSMAEIKDFVRVNVSVGSINLELPSKKGLDLDLSGRNVNVQSLANFDGKKEKNRIEGKLNGGGIPVEAKASIGSVTLDLQ